MSKGRVIFLCKISEHSGLASIGTAQEMLVGSGKRRLVSIVHYNQTNYSNNKLYSYMIARMCTGVQCSYFFNFEKLF